MYARRFLYFTLFISVNLDFSCRLRAQEMEFWREFSGHGNAIYSIAISSDGKLLATGSFDQEIRLWDLGSGKLKCSFAKSWGTVGCIAFSPDCRLLASVHSDRVAIWNLANSELVRTISFPRAKAIAFSPDSNIIAMGGQGPSKPEKLTCWNVDSAMIAHEIQEQGLIDSIQFSTDGKLIACGMWGDVVKVYRMESKELIAKTTSMSAKSYAQVKFIPTSNLLAVGTFRGIALWDFSVDQLTYLRKDEHMVGSLDIDSGGQFLCTGSSGKVTIWELASRRVVKEIPIDPTLDVPKVAMSPQGDFFVFTMGNHEKTKIVVWKLFPK